MLWPWPALLFACDLSRRDLLRQNKNTEKKATVSGPTQQFICHLPSVCIHFAPLTAVNYQYSAPPTLRWFLWMCDANTDVKERA